MVSITGSVRAGMEVAAAAADDLKRVHLELGGKAPVVVFDDADLEAAAEGIAVAGYFNAGQDCTAATRVLAGAPASTATSSPRSPSRPAAPRPAASTMPDAYFGPLNNPNQLERVAGFVDRAPDHAKVVAGGHRVGERGYFFAADRGRRAAAGRRDDPGRDLRPGHHRAAVHRRGRGGRAGPTASSTAWPRACGRRTTAAPCAWRKRLDFGCVWINTHIPLVAEMPHGGFKHSGYGKDLSMYGFEDYTRIKHVMSFIG